jgi:glycosyltransferase involved in cell wall biosynthesis
MNTRKPTVNIVIPVLNEEANIIFAINKLYLFCESNLNRYDWGITIADNGSVDDTYVLSQQISQSKSQVHVVRLEQAGRGRALKRVWLQSDCDIFAYMDVDLSTDLNHLPVLLDAVNTKSCSLATGSRLLTDSVVKNRSFKRGFISRCYSLLFRSMFLVSFKDAQCGFKAISKDSAHILLPVIQDTGWFFDTELMILASKNKYIIKEIPILLIDDPNSTVRILHTAWEDIKGLLRMRFLGLNKNTTNLLKL